MTPPAGSGTGTGGVPAGSTVFSEVGSERDRARNTSPAAEPASGGEEIGAGTAGAGGGGRGGGGRGGAGPVGDAEDAPAPALEALALVLAVLAVAVTSNAPRNSAAIADTLSVSATGDANMLEI